MLKYKDIPGAILKDASLGDRQIRVVVSTPTPDRVKDVMDPNGVVLSSYKNNPIVLADHDRKAPIGTAEIQIKGDRVEAVVTFAPEGISTKADEYCALAKAGILNTVSPGFQDIEAERIKGGGLHFKKWELLELSLVTVPANPEATIVERELPVTNLKCGASLNLPIDVTVAPFVSKDAAAGILKQAKFGEEDCNLSLARKGFLVYNANETEEEGSYMIPFAEVKDGRLTVTRKSLASAAEELQASSISPETRQKSQAVLDHYREKGFPPAKIKGLYGVSSLACCLADLGWLVESAEWECEMEGDGSQVPEMLHDALRMLGEALVAMTIEEVTELLGEDGEEKHAGRALTKAMASVREKAGRKLSAETTKAMLTACSKISEGHDMIKALTEEPEDDTSEDKSAPLSLTKRMRLFELKKRQTS